MEGILCIDKPPEHTSFDVVARMRGIAHTRKIGHGGTLDPLATGVLPLFFGRAAKACDLLPEQDKRYTATFRLGITTDTQDITGAVLAEQLVRASEKDVAALLASFTGRQQQVPPMYSAVRIDGQRLYDLARQGIEVERPARDITIHSVCLLESNEERQEYTIDVLCSKGTYIRTLCHDLGQALGCGAALTALRRTQACGFSISQCITLEEATTLAQANALTNTLLPVEAAFGKLPRLTLDARQAAHFCNGVPLYLSQFPKLPDSMCCIYRWDGIFLGLAAPDIAEAKLRLIKLFYLGDSQ